VRAKTIDGGVARAASMAARTVGGFLALVGCYAALVSIGLALAFFPDTPAPAR
jgi:hypothetical protein